MLGEDLQVLTVPDLLQLEQQLDLGSQRVRARKASARLLIKIKCLIMMYISFNEARIGYQSVFSSLLPNGGAEGSHGYLCCAPAK